MTNAKALKDLNELGAVPKVTRAMVTEILKEAGVPAEGCRILDNYPPG